MTDFLRKQIAHPCLHDLANISVEPISQMRVIGDLLGNFIGDRETVSSLVNATDEVFALLGVVSHHLYDSTSSLQRKFVDHGHIKPHFVLYPGFSLGYVLLYSSSDFFLRSNRHVNLQVHMPTNGDKSTGNKFFNEVSAFSGANHPHCFCHNRLPLRLFISSSTGLEMRGNTTSIHESDQAKREVFSSPILLQISPILQP